MLDGIGIIKAGAGLPAEDTVSRLIGESVRSPKIYGFRIDPSKSDPAQAVTYLADAVGKTPAAMGAGSFSYGGWADAFFMPRPCMLKYDGTVDYYLDPNDYTKKEDGTASDVANVNYGGNAMMEWPLIWFKYEAGEADGEGYFYCSDKRVDSSYKCWCNIDANDRIIPHFYTAVYNGTGLTKLRSLSGGRLIPANGAGNTTPQQENDRALANNTGDTVEWYTDVFCDRLLISGLLVLMGKSLDVPGVFGRGIGGYSTFVPTDYYTGTLNDKGLFWGSSGNNSAVKVFGMENWYGMFWRRTAGIMTDTHNKIYYKLTYGRADGSSGKGYGTDGSGYLSVNSLDSSGWVTKMDFTGGIPVPKAVSGDTFSDIGNIYYRCYYIYKPRASVNYGHMTRSLFGSGYDSNSNRLNLAAPYTLCADSADSATYLSTALSCKPAKK